MKSLHLLGGLIFAAMLSVGFSPPVMAATQSHDIFYLDDLNAGQGAGAFVLHDSAVEPMFMISDVKTFDDSVMCSVLGGDPPGGGGDDGGGSGGDQNPPADPPVGDPPASCSGLHLRL